MSEPTVHQPEGGVALEELEVSINDVDSISAEELLRETLKKLPAVRAARIMRGDAMISYQPQGVSAEQIRAAIERAGFTVDRVEGGRKSPERIAAEDTGKKIWRGPGGKEQAGGLDEVV